MEFCGLSERKYWLGKRDSLPPRGRPKDEFPLYGVAEFGDTGLAKYRHALRVGLGKLLTMSESQSLFVIILNE